MLTTALFGRSGHLPEIHQAAATECGLACLAMIASYHGRQSDLNTLRREYPVSLKGATLRTVMETAARLGLAGRPLRLEIGHLRSLRTPAILHWDMNHLSSCGMSAGRGSPFTTRPSGSGATALPRCRNILPVLPWS
jgi:ABC-type bacteriocin/lantibiotic exporter with double-glycine peptidase domain